MAFLTVRAPAMLHLVACEFGLIGERNRLRYILAFACSGEGFRRRLGAAVARLTEPDRLENRPIHGQWTMPASALKVRPDIIAHTLIKILANRGRPHMTELTRGFR